MVLLLVTGALYLWDLSASGWANSFYSAAVQAGSVSWKAFLFGASDAAASITVDKPPASLWVMALSVRVFGLNSWSMLVPQALMGVATVGLVYSSVRRYFSAQAGLIAGAVLALTPVAALMFRFNNPDALLVLLLTGAVVATLRAIENGRTRWMVLAGVLVGLGFLTKQLQAVLVLPGIAAVYLIAAPVSLWRRIRDGLIAVGAMLVSAGWWVAIVELTPAADRPYVGGSTDNSFLNLTFGYNGLGRIFGNSAPANADAAGSALGGRRGSRGWPAGGGGGGMFNSNVGIAADVCGRPRRSRRVAHPRGPDPRPRRSVGHRAAPAHRHPSRRALAVGRDARGHRTHVLPDGRHASTSTTRSPSRHRSARSSASAPGSCGHVGPSVGPAGARGRLARHHGLGVRHPRPGPPSGTRGCVGSCSWSASSPRLACFLAAGSGDRASHRRRRSPWLRLSPDRRPGPSRRS